MSLIFWAQISIRKWQIKEKMFWSMESDKSVIYCRKHNTAVEEGKLKLQTLVL